MLSLTARTGKRKRSYSRVVATVVAFGRMVFASAKAACQWQDELVMVASKLEQRLLGESTPGQSLQLCFAEIGLPASPASYVAVGTDVGQHCLSACQLRSSPAETDGLALDQFFVSCQKSALVALVMPGMWSTV